MFRHPSALRVTLGCPSLAVLAWLTGCGAPPAPTLDAVSPALVCDEAGVQSLTITGSALRATVTDALTDSPTLRLPELRLEPLGGLTVGEPAATDRAVELALAPDHVRWLDDTTLEIDIDTSLGLTPGTWDLVVTAVDGQQARLSPALAVAGSPSVTALAPDSVCHESGAATLTVEGEGFLVLDGAELPSVTVGDQHVVATAADGCAELSGPVAGQRCTTLVTEIDATLLALGDAEVSVQNPEPAACLSMEPATVRIALPPTISAVSPDTVCATDGQLVVEGVNFVEGMMVEVEGATVSSVSFVDDTTLEVELTGGTAGRAAVTVIDPSGCSDTLDAAIILADEPIVFYVDPPVVFSGADTAVSAFASDVFGQVTDLWLEHVEDGETRAVDWTWSADDPGAVAFVAPAGLADGEWLVVLTEDETCGSRSSAGFEVRSDLTVSIDHLEPELAWTYDDTAVEITATDPLPSGTTSFEQTPLVYLLGPDGAPDASRLPAVVWREDDRLTAIVPDGLQIGAYDVLVVNPDGALGLLTGGLTVTADANPTIDSVSPASISKSGDQEITIRGRDFRDPTVALECLASGVTTTAELTVDSASAKEIVATLAGGTLSESVCVVTVVDADGATARWSAISVTNPAQNLFPWSAGPELNVARRAPAAAAGRTNAVSRYVYAIGGDDGEASGAHDTVEVAEVGVYGTLGDWTMLADPLPGPRTLAAAVPIGRFLYLVGGSDGEAPVDSTLRAMILDPLQAPWFDGLSLARSSEAGLGPGRWTYQISALYDAADDANPGGEGLPSERITMNLPGVDGWLVPTVRWTAVSGAAGYRIYRSPEAGSASDALEWLADVDGGTLSFEDLGDATDAGLAPLPEGALGAWAELPAMSVAREAPCVAGAPDFELDPERYWIYAAGGLDEAGDPLDSIEVLEIVIESDFAHTAGGWTTIDATLSVPRHLCAGMTVGSDLHSVVADDETWVYFVGGEAERGTSGAVDSGRVGEDGALDDWQTTKDISPARSGVAHASASDYLYLFGGRQGSPHAGGVSGALDGSMLPEPSNWNSLGVSMSKARLMPGSAQESAVIIVVGGQTDIDDATTSTDLTNY